MDRKEMNNALKEQRKQFGDGIPECGSDSLRFALCSYPFKGNPPSLAPDITILSQSDKGPLSLYPLSILLSVFFHTFFFSSLGFTLANHLLLMLHDLLYRHS